MDALSMVQRLEVLLAEEREAIRRLDAVELERLAEEKERLGAGLRAAEQEALQALAPRLLALSGELRRNSVLLAHARDCVRDAIRVRCDLERATPTLTSGAEPARPGARISVRG